MKRLNLLAVLGLSLLALSACKMNKNEAAKDPVVAAKDIAVSIRENDFDRLSHILVPPDLYAKLEARYKEEAAKKPAPTAEESKQFADNIAKFTAADAEQKLFADIQPKLAQIGASQPMMAGMFQGMANQAIASNEKMTADEKTQTTAALNAIAKWAATAPLSDPEKAKQAIKIVVETARSLNLTTMEAARKLSFAETIQKTGMAVGGLRKTLAVYGFDTDKMLDSVKTEKKSEDGDNAVVAISYTLLDANINSVIPMVRVDGRWYSKAAIDSVKDMLAKPPVEAPATQTTGPAMQAPAENASSAMPAQGEQPAPSESSEAPASAASSSAGGQPSN
jgi:hypothetical protein